MNHGKQGEGFGGVGGPAGNAEEGGVGGAEVDRAIRWLL